MLPRKPTNLPPHLAFKIIRTYSQSGDLNRARQVFDTIPQPDLHLCSILIDEYTKNGFPKEATKLYDELLRRGVQADKLLILSVAKACAASSDITKAKKIHKDAVFLGLVTDLVLCNALIDMYGKCRHYEGAFDVFSRLPERDVISWTSFLSCCVSCRQPKKALFALREMGLTGIGPNSVTLSCVLPACSELRDLRNGRAVHGFVLRKRFEENLYVSSGLVNMYATCLRIKEARLVFDTMYRRDNVSWNAIITAYFVNGECEKAIQLFYRMRNEGVKLDYATWNAVIGGCMQNGWTKEAFEMLSRMHRLGFKPNQITITTLLPTCTSLESLRAGKEIHAYIHRHLHFEDVTIATAIVFMYAKCGDLCLARKVFNLMAKRDSIAWSTMIFANSMHGKGEEAVLLFRKMLHFGIKPNAMTFTGVLSGCSHSRLVDEALEVFNSMSRDHLIEPDAEHYSCLVDVLSRSGRLKEAFEFIEKMPIEPTASAWGALLGACRVYKNVDFGRIAAYKLFEIEPTNPGNYVLLSNILVSAKLWVEASDIRKLMKDRGIKKMPGCSWVMVRNKVHNFVAGDKRNDQSEKIQVFLNEIGEKMRLEGYTPKTEFVLQNVDQEEKEDILCNHSEKLAVSFGILNLNGGSCIRVFKNLRICGDCHSAINYIAKIVGVEIVVRDSLRFHHFRDGSCSCRNFW